MALLRRWFGAVSALVAIGLLDELGTGIPITGAGFLRARLGLSTSALTLALFTVPTAFALLVEPPLLLWASRRPRTTGSAWALIGVAAAASATALLRSYEGLVLALMLWYVATGLAQGLAQAELMDRAPSQRELNLTRWTLASALGDLLAPSLLALSVALGAEERGALAVVALLCLLVALWLFRLRRDDQTGHEHESTDALEKPRKSLRAILRNRRLLCWSLGAALCDLMDETLTALAALRVHERFGEQAMPLVTVLTAYMASSVLGLSALQRLLVSVSPVRLLCLSSVGSALAHLLFVASEGLLALTVAAFATGAFTAMHYPLAQAQAYRAAPDDSDWVTTLGSLLTGASLLWAPALGWLADTHGLSRALGLLVVQPLGLIMIALLEQPKAAK